MMENTPSSQISFEEPQGLSAVRLLKVWSPTSSERQHHWELLEMQVLRPQPKPAQSETGGRGALGPDSLPFSQPPGGPVHTVGLRHDCRSESPGPFFEIVTPGPTPKNSDLIRLGLGIFKNLLR